MKAYAMNREEATATTATVRTELSDGKTHLVKPNQAREQKPLSLWQLFKKMCSQDTRRALSATLGIVESFGKGMGSVATAKPHPGESDPTEIDSAAEPARRDR